MSQSLIRFGVTVCFILFSCSLAFAQATTEQLVVTTYFPSPAGSYRELRAQRMAIGNTYYSADCATGYSWTGGCGTLIGASADLVVEGDVAIGATVTPTAQLHTTGTVRFANFGAGTATFDFGGNLSSVSDDRLKKIKGNFTRGIESLQSIQPIIYKWNVKSGLETEHEYVGFSAQNIQESIPEGTGKGKDGYLSLQDRAIMATLVNAVKQQQQQIEELKEEIVRLKRR